MTFSDAKYLDFWHKVRIDHIPALKVDVSDLGVFPSHFFAPIGVVPPLLLL